jgi:hypothetical protein
MGHIFKKRFKKNTRNMARTNSNNTICAKALLKRIDKEQVNAAKNHKSK